MIGHGSRHGVSKIRVIDRVFRIGPEVMHAMTKLRQKVFQLFLHRVAAMISPYADASVLFRTSSGGPAHDLDAAIVDNICRKGRKARAFRDAQKRPAL